MGLHLTVVSYLTAMRASGRNLSRSFSSAKCLLSMKVCIGVFPKQYFPVWDL